MKRTRISEDTIVINKLFLIGNGFDLALNLKTSYNDFLLWLIRKYVFKALNSGIKEAPFGKYPGRYDEFMERYYIRNVFGFCENELFDVLVNEIRDFSSFDSIDNVPEFLNYLNKYNVEVNSNIENGLMDELLKMCKVGWVDVEGVYFNLLKNIIRLHKDKPQSKVLQQIEFLNAELSCLITELKNYLKEIEIDIPKNKAEKYLHQFEQDLKQNDFSFLHGNFEEIKQGEVYFLNFNYTNSLSDLLNKFEDFKFTQNFIHGNLEDEESSIIFGFGDEMDSVYKEMEELNDNRFFKHIKSFQYFKTPNYRQLLSFLNSGDYQVCIYGHSCGLSDRIMLNEIFEHDNCKSIRIYYYNDNDFTNKTMEISRHFNSNQVMRKKIVEKSIHDLIPQIVD